MIARTAKELEKIGAAFAKKLSGGDIVALQGELGAGKTTFVRGVANALGIRKRIPSPTFTIMNVYKLPRAATKKFHAQRLVHADTYRLEKPEEIFTLGLDEYLTDGESIVIIEWAERVSRHLSGHNQLAGHKVKKIAIKITKNGRRINI
ncbi:MAG: tRNA ((37)-N6)-threonylcarbamoyltransferase complex ATPase subunit type 1 TsaE [Candidatus Magasanikbacteria bacterium]|nr:tRNA ((37)-N6)-threonylcarbamoyltransferase complex ATPase subunit type 1 TsaE [Candidatus Magasanikbacteria bacterium]